MELIDEVEHRVITIEWDDFGRLPDLDACVISPLLSRRTSIADEAIDFLAELRRLNRTHAVASGQVAT